jgi:hypothetical protein
VQWAEETHAAAQFVWRELPESRIVDDDYYRKVRPVLDRQLAIAGVRLARFLDDAYAGRMCAK